MSVRAKRGRRWPDEYGNYEIVQDQHNGSVLQWVDRGTFGPDTEAVAERILVAINGDTVPAPTLPEDVGEDAVERTAERVVRWTSEAPGGAS